MTKRASKQRLQLSKFKLNSLLEITRAINENLTTEELLERYQKLLREDLNIGKILIYKYGEHWENILSSGCDKNAYENISVENDLLEHKEITFVPSSEENKLSSFDIIIPVFNKNVPLAYVLIGDIDEEAEGMSPVLKHLHFIQTLSNIIMVAIENIRLFNEILRQEAFKKELELASKMQNLLIPDNVHLPQNKNLFTTGFYQPHYDIGGDYYDCLYLSNNDIGFCIADVSGKGISAALLMANFQANMRALFTHDIRLESLVTKLNERVIRSVQGEKFITLFVARYNFESHKLEYINAAHNPPVIYYSDSKEIVMPETSCVGMGMLDEIPVIRKGLIKIVEHTKILCYTDGLSELPDENGKEIGTSIIEKYISNKTRIDKNIGQIIRSQKIPDGNDRMFDDISILGVELFV
ncbi:MAG: serine/threonine-protein phosphatase [Bacteroidetes bacterium]|nr:serine/threonine-protein phosphatase [Bacteroidota bacterium]